MRWARQWKCSKPPSGRRFLRPPLLPQLLGVWAAMATTACEGLPRSSRSARNSKPVDRWNGSTRLAGMLLGWLMDRWGASDGAWRRTRHRDTRPTTSSSIRWHVRSSIDRPQHNGRHAAASSPGSCCCLLPAASTQTSNMRMPQHPRGLLLRVATPLRALAGAVGGQFRGGRLPIRNWRCDDAG